MKRWIKQRIYELQLHCPRFKLWRLCKLLGVKLYPWQREFALGHTDSIPAELTYIRASGKTMAVWLRLLMANPGQPIDILKVLNQDPDFTTTYRRRLLWYQEEYWVLSNKCRCNNIPCQVDLRIYALGKEDT